MDKDSSSIQKWSFDVLSTDMKIDKECQIGFCPEEKKGGSLRSKGIMERRCHAFDSPWPGTMGQNC